MEGSLVGRRLSSPFMFWKCTQLLSVLNHPQFWSGHFHQCNILSPIGTGPTHPLHRFREAPWNHHLNSQNLSKSIGRSVGNWNHHVALRPSPQTVDEEVLPPHAELLPSFFSEGKLEPEQETSLVLRWDCQFPGFWHGHHTPSLCPCLSWMGRLLWICSVNHDVEKTLKSSVQSPKAEEVEELVHGSQARSDMALELSLDTWWNSYITEDLKMYGE